MSAEYHKLVKTVSDSLEFYELIGGESIETQRVEFLHLPRRVASAL